MEDREKLACSECDFFTHKESKLLKHVLKAHKKTVQKCPFCTDSHYSTSLSALALHKKREHRQVRLNCFLCEFNTRALKKWMKHMTQAHGGQTHDLFNLCQTKNCSVGGSLKYQTRDDIRLESVYDKTIKLKHKCKPYARRTPKKDTESKEPQKLIDSNVESSGICSKKKRTTDKQKSTFIDVKNTLKSKKSYKAVDMIEISSDEASSIAEDSDGDNKNIDQTIVENGNCDAKKTGLSDIVNSVVDVLSSDDNSMCSRGEKSNILPNLPSTAEVTNRPETERNVSNKGKDNSCLDEMFNAAFSVSSSGEQDNCTDKNVVTESNVGNKPDASEMSLIICPYCKNNFTSYKLLHEHCRDKHPMFKSPYGCPDCKHSCLHLSMLVRHMRSHTKQKPFACNICLKRFVEKSVLKTHLLIHTNEKQYACHLCSYKCNYKSDLTVHFRYHTNERPYKCTMCDHASHTFKNLKIHLRTHTGEKPYQCKLCKSKFSQLGSLKTHNERVVCI